MSPTCIFSCLVTDCLTNSAVQLLRVMEHYHPAGNPFDLHYSYWAELTCLATGGSDGYYDLEFPKYISNRETALDYTADHFASAPINILSPVHDPYHILSPATSP